MYEIAFNDLSKDISRFGLSYNKSIYHLGTSKEVCDVISRLPKDVLFSVREYDLDSVDDILSNFELIQI